MSSLKAVQAYIPPTKASAGVDGTAASIIVANIPPFAADGTTAMKSLRITLCTAKVEPVGEAPGRPVTLIVPAADMIAQTSNDHTNYGDIFADPTGVNYLKALVSVRDEHLKTLYGDVNGQKLIDGELFGPIRSAATELEYKLNVQMVVLDASDAEIEIDFSANTTTPNIITTIYGASTFGDATAEVAHAASGETDVGYSRPNLIIPIQTSDEHSEVDQVFVSAGDSEIVGSIKGIAMYGTLDEPAANQTNILVTLSSSAGGVFTQEVLATLSAPTAFKVGNKWRQRYTATLTVTNGVSNGTQYEVFYALMHDKKTSVWGSPDYSESTTNWSSTPSQSAIVNPATGIIPAPLAQRLVRDHIVSPNNTGSVFITNELSLHPNPTKIFTFAGEYQPSRDAYIFASSSNITFQNEDPNGDPTKTTAGGQTSLSASQLAQFRWVVTVCDNDGHPLSSVSNSFEVVKKSAWKPFATSASHGTTAQGQPAYFPYWGLDGNGTWSTGTAAWEYLTAEDGLFLTKSEIEFYNSQVAEGLATVRLGVEIGTDPLSKVSNLGDMMDLYIPNEPSFEDLLIQDITAGGQQTVRAVVKVPDALTRQDVGFKWRHHGKNGGNFQTVAGTTISLTQELTDFVFTLSHAEISSGPAPGVQNKVYAEIEVDDFHNTTYGDFYSSVPNGATFGLADVVVRSVKDDLSLIAYRTPDAGAMKIVEAGKWGSSHNNVIYHPLADCQDPAGLNTTPHPLHFRWQVVPDAGGFTVTSYEVRVQAVNKYDAVGLAAVGDSLPLHVASGRPGLVFNPSVAEAASMAAAWTSYVNGYPAGTGMTAAEAAGEKMTSTAGTMTLHVSTLPPQEYEIVNIMKCVADPRAEYGHYGRTSGHADAAFGRPITHKLLGTVGAGFSTGEEYNLMGLHNDSVTVTNQLLSIVGEPEIKAVKVDGMRVFTNVDFKQSVPAQVWYGAAGNSVCDAYCLVGPKEGSARVGTDHPYFTSASSDSAQTTAALTILTAGKQSLSAPLPHFETGPKKTWADQTEVTIEIAFPQTHANQDDTILNVEGAKQDGSIPSIINFPDVLLTLNAQVTPAALNGKEGAHFSPPRTLLCAFPDAELNETFIATKQRDRAVNVLHSAWATLVNARNTKNNFQSTYDSLHATYQAAVSQEETLKAGVNFAAHAEALAKVEELKPNYLATKAAFEEDVAEFYKGATQISKIVNGVIVHEMVSGLGMRVRKAIIQMYATSADAEDTEGFSSPAAGTAAAIHVTNALAPYGQNNYPVGAELETLLQGARVNGHGFEALMLTKEQALTTAIANYVNSPAAQKAATGAALVLAQNEYDAAAANYQRVKSILDNAIAEASTTKGELKYRDEVLNGKFSSTGQLLVDGLVQVYERAVRLVGETHENLGQDIVNSEAARQNAQLALYGGNPADAGTPETPKAGSPASIHAANVAALERATEDLEHAENNKIFYGQLTGNNPVTGAAWTHAEKVALVGTPTDSPLILASYPALKYTYGTVHQWEPHLANVGANNLTIAQALASLNQVFNGIIQGKREEDSNMTITASLNKTSSVFQQH